VTTSRSRLGAWLLRDLAHGQVKLPKHSHTAPWWQVMCLTGVDYFSTLGYQPSFAFVAAGYLSPFATLVLVLVTLFGALPMYNRIAALSPHGQGSLSVLEERLPRWRGKGLVLVMLGFAATSFIITITLSAADATAHIIENPLVPHSLNHPVIVTTILIIALGAVFLRGFGEAIWLAVLLVAIYLVLNVVVISYELWILWHHPTARADWGANLFSLHPNPVMMLGAAALLFPKLALGLSGFETGVAVMPLVKGEGESAGAQLLSRVANTRKLLSTAAFIMSVLLIGSSLVTTMLIPADAMKAGGEANGRALAYLAHRDLGEWVGTAYDLSTIAILWFAGASALAGLLNLVPRYLPRYGMAPDWARATRPLVLVITAVGVLVTIVFEASVDQQGGAYATGVLMLMTSAAIAILVAQPLSRWRFVPITAIFVYTTVANIIERPEGLKIATWFIVAIIMSSLVSRVMRSTEIRLEGVHYDETAETFIQEARGRKSLRIIANRPDSGQREEYPVLFLEVRPGDASEFTNVLNVRGARVAEFHVLRCTSPAIPNAIAGLLMDLRDRTDCIPHAYFGWTEGNPMAYLLKFLAFGEGDTAPVCREVLRQAEPHPERRPRIHVG
jgi:hypothetical protein